MKSKGNGRNHKKRRKSRKNRVENQTIYHLTKKCATLQLKGMGTTNE